VRRRHSVRFAAALALALAAAAARANGPTASTYTVLYDARIVPTRRAADVEIRVTGPPGSLRGLRLSIDPARHLEFAGDGEIELGPDWVDWTPPEAGGVLRYVFRIDQKRNARSYDARCAENWAVFRGDDLVPPARARTRAGALSEATLRLRLPQGWSAVTRYRASSGTRYPIDDPKRRFDRPTGWILAGQHLGVRREKVAGVRVAIAGPSGQGVRRLDMLALLRWTLPTLREIVGTLPERLLVVGTGDPMWRGGLSGPGSLFLHAERPLITPDTTSPLLHEVNHVVFAPSAGPESDWLVEGLAELYSLELLVRSRTVSRSRFERALERLAAEGRAPKRDGSVSADDVTAWGVTTLRALDTEIRDATQEQRSLDDVVRRLAEDPAPLDVARLRSVSEAVVGAPLGTFFHRHGLDTQASGSRRAE
jgi:hypothetical protein